MKFPMKLAAIGLASALSSLSFASTNLVTNGDFEASSFSGAFATYSAGSSSLAGWTIEDGSIDLINTYWTPASGNYSIDLSGNFDGIISQDISTVVGQRYHVSFSMAGNPDDSSDLMKTIQVGLSQQPLYTFDVAGKSRTNMGWETKGFDFIATATTSKLFFAGTQESAYGAALDNISVTAVPEPGTYAMFLAGLGLMAGVARRRSLQK